MVVQTGEREASLNAKYWIDENTNICSIEVCIIGQHLWRRSTVQVWNDLIVYNFFQLILHLHWRKEVLNRTNKLVRIRNYPHRLKRMKQVLPYYWNAIIMTRYIHQRVSTLNYFRYTVPTLLLFPVAAVSDMNGGRVDLILQGNWYISAHCAHCTRAAPNTGGARVNGILVCRIEVKPFQWEKDTFWEKCGPFPDLFCSFCRLCRGEEVL